MKKSGSGNFGARIQNESSGGELGNLLRNRRVSLNLTAEKAAKFVGMIHVKNMYLFERGQAPLPGKYIPRLAVLYDIPEITLVELAKKQRAMFATLRQRISKYYEDNAE